MQLAELRIIGKWQIDVCALDVSPAMPRASEDSIESLIDDVVLVRPKTEFPLGIHARMHAGRQQARAETRKLAIRSLHVALEGLSESV